MVARLKTELGRRGVEAREGDGLAALSETTFDLRWPDLSPAATVSGGDILFRADAQAGWVATLQTSSATHYSSILERRRIENPH